jgi:hypothetical protein
MLQGRANNVQQEDAPLGRAPYTWVDFLAGIHGIPDTEDLVVEITPKAPAVLRGNCYRVYGIVSGTETVQVVLTGAQHQVTVVRAYAWEPAPNLSAYTCAPP